MNEIKYRELRIRLSDSALLVIDVGSKEEVKAALADVDNWSDLSSANDNSKSTPTYTAGGGMASAESPESRLEVRAGLRSGALTGRTIVGFKDGSPQLMRPTSFATISDALLTLIFAVEAGLKRSSISFEDFRSLYDLQNIKSGSPLTMLLNNLKNAGYIDKAQYLNERTIRLTAKGETKATEILTALTGQS